MSPTDLFIKGIYWQGLRLQKEALLDLATKKDHCLDSYHVEAIDGIIHLLDAIQDIAVDHYQIDEEIVFPGLKNEEL